MLFFHLAESFSLRCPGSEEGKVDSHRHKALPANFVAQLWTSSLHIHKITTTDTGKSSAAEVLRLSERSGHYRPVSNFGK